MSNTYREYAGAHPFLEQGGISTAQTLAIDTANEAVAAIFTMPVDDTITHVGFVNGSVTGTNTLMLADAYTVSIQGVTAGGVPDGTILGGGSPASQTFPNATYPGSGFGTASSHIIALANSIALQAGMQYAIVIQHTGLTDLVNYLNPRYAATVGGVISNYPYSATADATPTWTKAAVFPFYWFLRSATRTYLYPVLAAASQALGATSEKGFTFSRNAGYGASNTYALRGVRMMGGGTGMAAAGTYTVNLYSDPTGTPVIRQTTGTLDSDIFGSTTASRGWEALFPEDTLYELTPGTKYGIGISHSGATSLSISTLTLPDAGSRDAWPMGGLTYCARTLASAYPPDASDGAFAETTTTIVNAELIFAGFTAAGGGGMRLAGAGGLAAG